jgi:hypothetical protein
MSQPFRPVSISQGKILILDVGVGATYLDWFPRSDSSPDFSIAISAALPFP